MSLERAKGLVEQVGNQMGSLLVPYQRLTLAVGLAIANALIALVEQGQEERAEFFGDALAVSPHFSPEVREQLDELAAEAIDDFVQLGEDDDV